MLLPEKSVKLVFSSFCKLGRQAICGGLTLFLAISSASAEDPGRLERDTCHSRSILTKSGAPGLVKWPWAVVWSGQDKLLIVDVAVKRNRLVEIDTSGKFLKDYRVLSWPEKGAERRYPIEAPLLVRRAPPGGKGDKLFLLDDGKASLKDSPTETNRSDVWPDVEGGRILRFSKSETDLNISPGEKGEILTIEGLKTSGKSGQRLWSLVDFVALSSEKLLALGMFDGGRLSLALLDYSSPEVHPLPGYENYELQLGPQTPARELAAFDYYRHLTSSMTVLQEGVGFVLLIDPTSGTFSLGRINTFAGNPRVEVLPDFPEDIRKYKDARMMGGEVAGPSRTIAEFYRGLESITHPSALVANQGRLHVIARVFGKMRGTPRWEAIELDPSDGKEISRHPLPTDSPKLLVAEGSFFAFFEQELNELRGGVPFVSSRSFVMVPDFWLTAGPPPSMIRNGLHKSACQEVD